jgi:hypothetical protein
LRRLLPTGRPPLITQMVPLEATRLARRELSRFLDMRYHFYYKIADIVELGIVSIIMVTDVLFRMTKISINRGLVAS